MVSLDRYSSPIGELLLKADGDRLTGLVFADSPPLISSSPLSPVLTEARNWLDEYFSGRDPGAPPPLCLSGTPFQQEVWDLLQKIPYGQTVTYGALAEQLAEERGCGQISARAVGGAVGRNPISIMVPCHRVVGAGGRLTGYAWGLEKKAFLLRLEGAIL